MKTQEKKDLIKDLVIKLSDQKIRFILCLEMAVLYTLRTHGLIPQV